MNVFLKIATLAIVWQTLEAQDYKEHALFVRHGTLQEGKRVTRQTSADQMVQNILQWIQGVYTQNSRRIRQGSFREYLPPTNTQKPSPFKTPNGGDDNYIGYPPLDQTPVPPFNHKPSKVVESFVPTGTSIPAGFELATKPSDELELPSVQPSVDQFVPQNQQFFEPKPFTKAPEVTTVFQGYPIETSPNPEFTYPPSTYLPVTKPPVTKPPVTRPTYPTVPPTYPTKPPTYPPTYPTKPPTYPTKPPTYPTKPPTYPTKPPTYPTYPTNPPTYPPPTRPPTYPPPTYPTKPPTYPTKPPTYPTKPPTYPTKPPTYPTKPPPTYPPTQPPITEDCTYTPHHEDLTHPPHLIETESPVFTSGPADSKHEDATDDESPAEYQSTKSPKDSESDGSEDDARETDKEDLKHPPHIHNIDVECSKEMMTINIEFNRIFNGVIYSKGYYKNPECRYVMENSNGVSYKFTVSLNSCGTEFINAFDTQGQSYLENVLVLQNEAGIQEVWDTIRSVRCLWEGNLNKQLSVALNVGMLSQEIVTFSGDTAMAKLDIQNGHGPFAPSANGLVKIGDTMTLVVSVSGDPGFDIQVKDCRAKDSTGNSIVSLTDDDGCVLKPKLFGAFQKTRDTQNTGASIISYAYFNAFKFPDVTDLMIECNVELCKSECEVCTDPGKKVEPGRKKRSVNETSNGAVTMGKTMKVILPEDLNIDEFTTENFCVSMQNFLITTVLLIAILTIAAISSAHLWLKRQQCILNHKI